MAEATTISITFALEERADEHLDKASIDHTVQRNWISKGLVNVLRLPSSPGTANESQVWNERLLRSIGQITVNWSRDGVPKIFETRCHIFQDDAKHLIIGDVTLRQEPQIENPSKGAYPLARLDADKAKKADIEAKCLESIELEEQRDAKRANKALLHAPKHQKGNQDGQGGQGGASGLGTKAPAKS